ncbi:MAG: hypothetical protein OXC57_03145, partial [Rhodobacteraceae bacterium]|nr:hypothetical protein [Paracoccaceae bacterium]
MVFATSLLTPGSDTCNGDRQFPADCVCQPVVAGLRFGRWQRPTQGETHENNHQIPPPQFFIKLTILLLLAVLA